MLLTNYRNDIWKIFSDALLTEDPIMRIHITSLFGVDTDFKGNYQGVMHILSNEFLMNWCDENVDKAPQIICMLIPIIIKNGDGNSFHPVIQYLIDKYGNNENVLINIYRNLGPSSWSGSVIPFYEQQINVLNELITHTNLKVRDWAKRIIGDLRVSIEKERQKEDEESIGIY